jgi:hypothetical protein
MTDHSSLLPSVKDAIIRLTSVGNGHESGVSLDEVTTEVRSIFRHRVFPPDLRDRIASILLHPPHSHLFRQSRRPDGSITFLNSVDPLNPIFGELPPLLFPDPTTVPELKDEVKGLQTRKEELLREEQFLLFCQQLLQNPGHLQDETQRLETVLLNMREVQCIVDYKIKEVLDFMRVHGSDND